MQLLQTITILEKDRRFLFLFWCIHLTAAAYTVIFYFWQNKSHTHRTHCIAVFQTTHQLRSNQTEHESYNNVQQWNVAHNAALVYPLKRTICHILLSIYYLCVFYCKYLFTFVFHILEEGFFFKILHLFITSEKLRKCQIPDKYKYLFLEKSVACDEWLDVKTHRETPW